MKLKKIVKIKGPDCSSKYWSGIEHLPECKNEREIYQVGASSKKFISELAPDAYKNRITTSQKTCLLDETKGSKLNKTRKILKGCLQDVAPTKNKFNVNSVKGLSKDKNGVLRSFCTKGRPCIKFNQEVANGNLSKLASECGVKDKFKKMFKHDKFIRSSLATVRCQDNNKKNCTYTEENGKIYAVPVSPSAYKANAIMMVTIDGETGMSRMPGCRLPVGMDNDIKKKSYILPILTLSLLCCVILTEIIMLTKKDENGEKLTTILGMSRNVFIFLCTILQLTLCVFSYLHIKYA